MQAYENSICAGRSGAVDRGGERHQDNQETRPSLGFGVDVLLKTSNFTFVGVIQDIRPHALSVLVHRACTEGTVVSIEFGAAAREGEVVSCRPKGNSYELYIAFPNENKEDVRAAERFPVIQEVKIYAANSESPLEAMTGNLSSNGLGLETSTPLETGETIMAVSNCNEAFGVVRHCKQLDSGRFQTGVEVFHVMPKEASMSQGDSTKSELG